MSDDHRGSGPEPAPYTPIDCSLHDRLEALATVGRHCQIVYRAEDGTTDELTGRIADVFAQRGAEYLRLESGAEVRLDRLVQVDGVEFGGGPGT